MKNKLVIVGIISIITTSLSFTVNAAADPVKAASCVGCHGTYGVSENPSYPNLAGQKQRYLLKQLKDFKSGTRIDPTMKAMTATLTDTDMINLATYFSQLKPTKVSKTKAATNKVATTTASKREFPKNVYVSMKKSATIENFPSENSWQGGPNMLYTAVSPNGKIVLSTSPSNNTVYAFDAASGKQLAIIAVGKAPKGVKITPNGQFAYVSNQGSSNISVVSLKTLKVVNTIKTEQGPHNARFTNDGKTAYVTLQGGAGIAVIDVTKGKMVRVIPVPGITGPHNIDLSADEKTAYVRDFVHHVAVLELKSGKVKKIIKVGNGHGGIDTSPNGKFVATAAIGDNFISIIDTKTLSVKKILVGNGPHGIRASVNSDWIYVSLAKENRIAIINSRTMKLEKKISTGKFPFWIAVKGNP